MHRDSRKVGIVFLHGTVYDFSWGPRKNGCGPPQGRASTELLLGSLQACLISCHVYVLGSVSTWTPNHQRGKSCLGLLGSESEAPQQREFPTQKLIPCLARVSVLSTPHTNMKDFHAPSPVLGPEGSLFLDPKQLIV